MPKDKPLIKFPKVVKPNKKGNRWINLIRTVSIYALIAFLALIFLVNLSGGVPNSNEEPISQVMSDIKADKVSKLDVQGNIVDVTYKDNHEASARKEDTESIYQILKDSNVDPNKISISVRDISLQQNWLTILGTVAPIVFLGVFIFMIFRQAREGAQGIFSFGQSRAKVYSKDAPAVKFDDIAGVDEAKRELSEIVEFLKTPEKFKALGARIPKGVLLVGPSGVGKTLLARAVAGQAGVPFFSIAGSEFMEMLVGVGASIVGSTPILIRDEKGTRLLPIGEFADQYYNINEENVVKPVTNTQTLGFQNKKNGFWGTRDGNQLIFDHSRWQSISGIYRHNVDSIYEIDYLGGKLQTTGDHSVFVRKHGRIISKKVSDLKKGELLVELPLNIRHWDPLQRKTIHLLKAHKFSNHVPLYLDFWGDDQSLQQKYEYILASAGTLATYQIAQMTGVSQTTVINWQSGKHIPMLLSKKLVKLDLPSKVLVTPDLMKVFGYYTAEGRNGGNLEFTFGQHEPEVYGDCVEIMRRVFRIEPIIKIRDDHSVKIIYYSHHLERFFARHCGNGSHNKHVPEFIWDLTKEYFLSYLEGYSKGDGYITKSGKLSMSSVSHQLITELSWLCAMHGIKSGIKHEFLKEGRVIVNKPLPGGEYWSLIIGRTSNPFLGTHKYPYQIKRAIIKKVTKKKYRGYVYDLCGVENEAFFGGEKPVLLHNSRVRDLFGTAKKNAPAIIFIDEVESIGRMRGSGMVGGHDEREQTLNQILVEMDGFTPNDSVIIIAATNRPDMLDPALVRPGRFDRRVVLGLPDIEERKAIIGIHMKGKPFDSDVSVERLARRTVGFSGADLANMLNEAAILAARENKKAIDNKDLEEAATKEKMGPQRKRMQTEGDRKLSAYHEAGHAIVGHFLKNVDPVHRISIVARGMSGGHTMFPPTEDRSNETKSRLLDQIAAALGGQAAEELVFKDISTGASSDIEVATSIARQMVTQYGMSPLGPINLHSQAMFGIWSRGDEGGELSPEMKNSIDREVKKIMAEAFKIAINTIKKNRAKLDKVAKELLEKETLEGDEFEKLVGKKV